MGLFRRFLLIFGGSTSPKPAAQKFQYQHESNVTTRTAVRTSVPRPASPKPNANSDRVYKKGEKIVGKCHVIDGDTIVIKNQKIRLYGIDAPEIDRPYGKTAKFGLIKIIQGQVVCAVAEGDESYDRVIASCYLPNGTNISEEMVRQGLALDYSFFSKGRYRHLEPSGVRKKLFEKARELQGNFTKEYRTLGALRANNIQLQSHCYSCGLTLKISPDLYIARFGENFSLIGRVTPCQSSNCCGKSIFLAQRENEYVPLL